MSAVVEIGPQHAADNRFTERMRLHQSWWRARVLGLPYGPSQTGDPYGNFLRQEDADAGRNFLTPQIAAVADARIASGSGVEPFRCRRNLLSSQPMCFNLFAPFHLDLGLATELLRTVIPDEVQVVTDVRIEYAPSPRERFTGDHSSFDAFIQYVDGDGDPAFIGIETKLTEPFSREPYGKDRHMAYGTLTDADDAPWHADGRTKVEEVGWNQLWRNHLLVEAVRKHPDRPHGKRGWLAVVHHPLDSSCLSALRGYRDLLSAPDDCLLDWSLDRLVTAWAPLVEGSQKEWLDAFNRRYVDLGGSDGLD